MGICSNSSQTKQKQITIGGGGDGRSTWKVLHGVEQQNIIINYGWKMKFQLSSNGIMSGGNKNDNEKDALIKIYVGTLKDKILDCKAIFEDGAEIKYDGQIEESIMKVICKVIKGNYKFQEGDIALCVGSVKYY